MKLVDMTCPHCGATLKIDPVNKKAVCKYCGTALMIDDEVQHVRYDNAEEAGYKFEKGRQRAQAEAQGNVNRTNIPQQNQQSPKKKRRTWLWILGWICVFPVPLTILMLRKKEMKPILKYGIIAVAWIVYLWIGATGNSNKSSTTQSSSANKTTQEGVSNTQEETPSEISPEEKEIAQETDMDIVMRDGHPTYYGSVEQSHAIWDDVEKGKIQFGDNNHGYDDATILYMDAYKDSDIIRDVYINFSAFSNSPDVTLDEALQVATSYMPFDIMDQYYEYRGSEMLVPNDTEETGNQEEESTHYVISYGLTEEGSDSYYKNEHEYSGSIDVIIEVKNSLVKNISIQFGKPRWMGSLSLNGYHKEEWSCNLYDYK